MFKVIVINASGSVKQKAQLSESGLIEFEDGTFSHIIAEKQFNKIIQNDTAPENEEKALLSEVSPTERRGAIRKPKTAKK
jgi:hypothetical protein